MNLRMIGLLALIIGLGVSLGFNIFAALGTPTVLGVADSKSIGRGLDARGDPQQQVRHRRDGREQDQQAQAHSSTITITSSVMPARKT